MKEADLGLGKAVGDKNKITELNTTMEARNRRLSIAEK